MSVGVRQSRRAHQSVNRIGKKEEFMKNLIARFIHETEGQDLIEYALLAALIGLATTLAMQNLATSISTEFSNIGTAVSTAS